MGQKVVWFLLGAIAASVGWLALLSVLDAQLLRTFLGAG
jgi:arginine exporter protein ArgO